MFKNILNYIKAHKWVAVLIGAVVIGGGYFLLKPSAPKVEYVTEKVQRSDLKQTVSVTGKVLTSDEVDLKFGAQGQIAVLNVAVGDAVLKDQIIAELDHRDIDSQIRQAQSSLKSQQANLSKVYEGASASEVNVAFKKVQQAEVTYKNSQTDYTSLVQELNTNIISLAKEVSNLALTLEDTKISSQLSIDNALVNWLVSINQGVYKAENSIDVISTLFDDDDLEKYYSGANTQYDSDTTNLLLQITPFLTQAKDVNNIAQSTKTLSTAQQATSDLKVLITRAENLASTVILGLGATVSNADLTQADIDVFKGDVKAEQDIINSSKIDLSLKEQAYNSAISSKPITDNGAQSNYDSSVNSYNNAKASQTTQLAKAQSAIASADAALKLAQADYERVKASARSSDVLYAQAQVGQAQAKVEELIAKLNDYLLKAPFDGTVAKVNYKINEKVDGSIAVITLIGAANYKVEVDIPEADIAKVKVGDRAELSLDAFGSDILFNGTVSSVEPAETVISDVVYYKVDLTLDSAGREVKKGMTANIDIMTAEAKNVLNLPARSVLRQDGRDYVRILKNGEVIEATVTTGLRGDGGRLEITSGLEEGDEVIVFEKKL